MRTGSRKAFEMSDGTKQMIVCPKAGDFKEVDNSLVIDEADKCVIFRDAETCDEVFTIPSPFMVDSDGAVSTAVSYEMRPTNAGKLMLTIIANEDWINAKERAFPVTIDPQITLAQKNSFDSYSYMSGTVSAGVLPIVGIYLSNGVVSVNRMYISFDNLNIPRNIKIKNTEYDLCNNLCTLFVDPCLFHYI